MQPLLILLSLIYLFSRNIMFPSYILPRIALYVTVVQTLFRSVVAPDGCCERNKPEHCGCSAIARSWKWQ
jgi:hypothetical protein